MYLKINRSVIKRCRRPSMGVALSGLWALDTARQFQQFLFKRDLARSCDIMFLIVLCSFWLHFSKLFLLLVRKNPRKNWKNDCLHLTIISNKMTNILEVSQFCYSGREKKNQEYLNLFFSRLSTYEFCSLYNPNYCFPTTSVLERQGRFWTKKSHCPLDFHQSLLLLHLLPLCSLPLFSLFSMGIYCPATISESLSKPRGWLVSPWKSLYSSPLAP